MPLLGCDTFVVLPPCTENNYVIFGKNADRPRGEVQEILFQQSESFKEGDKLMCTYIEIDQVPSTHAVLLSKPAWMWGAEMGANDCGVVIGNEAVWTVVDEEILTEKLLGMDLLRLGLERSSNSYEAVKVITTLLEKYGQGGPCSDCDVDLLYHNSFLITDKKEAWVLETAGQLWAAEKVTSGFRNISNCLSIGNNISVMSDGVLSFARDHDLWNGVGDFSFKEVFSSGGCSREAAGRKLLVDLTIDGQFDVNRMFQVLRDKKSGICMPVDDPFHTAGSWVSVLNNSDMGAPDCHWVTGTPDPSVSIFKPFIFTPTPNISAYITSPKPLRDPAKTTPRFQFEVDRRHTLYKLTKNVDKSSLLLRIMKKEEEKMIAQVSNMLSGLGTGTADLQLFNNLLKDSVEKEINIYNNIF